MSSLSSNRFALLSEDGDDAPAPADQKNVPAPVAAAPNKPIPVPTQKPKQGQQSGRGRGGDYPARGGARNVYREDREAQPAAGGGAEDGREPRGERRGGRGGPRGGRGALGRGRGGRGGAKSDRPDRHSQTGVTDTDKKIASGWGAEEGKSELRAETDGWGDAKADASIPGTPGANGTEAAPAVDAPVAKGAEEEAAAPVEEEDNTKTYEEFLAERAAATRIGGPLSGRQANEGADESQWKDGVQLLKEDQEDADWFMGKAQSKKASTSAAKKTKTFIDVEPVGYRPPRSDRGGGRGGRGGERGGDRGGRGRGEGRGRGRGEGRGGGFRGGRGGAPNRDFNADDSSAFPSLS